MTDSEQHDSDNVFLTDDGEPLDVSAVMRDIRRRVAERRRAGVYPPAPTAGGAPTHVPVASGWQQQSAADGLAVLRANAHLEIEGDPITSHRRYTGPIIKGFKRFSRFWIRRYTDTLFLRQSYFNSEAVSAMAAMRHDLEELRAEVETLRRQLAAPPDGSGGAGDPEI